MKVKFFVVSKDCRVNRCTKEVELEASPQVGQTFVFPVGEGGADAVFTVRYAHGNEAEFEYEPRRLSLEHLIADGWEESYFCWPS